MLCKRLAQCDQGFFGYGQVFARYGLPFELHSQPCLSLASVLCGVVSEMAEAPAGETVEAPEAGVPAAELPADGAADTAARCLESGGLVAFPTETVYGLGADATIFTVLVEPDYPGELLCFLPDNMENV